MTKNTREHRYFQFPLCLLQPAARGEMDAQDLADHIIAWGLVVGGPRRFQSQDPMFEEFAHQEVRQKLQEGSLPTDFNRKDADHWTVMRSNEHFELPIVSVLRTINRYEFIERLLKAYLRKVGDNKDDMYVRMRRDYVLDLKSGKITLRQFCLLAGFKGAIGKHAYWPVRRSHLRYLSAGYKSKAAFEAVNGDSEGDELLTLNQVDYTRDKLLDRGFICRVHKGRTAYFSYRLERDKLAKAVAKREAVRLKRKIAEEKAMLQARKENDELRAELQRLRSQNRSNAASDKRGVEQPEDRRSGQVSGSPRSGLSLNWGNQQEQWRDDGMADPGHRAESARQRHTRRQDPDATFPATTVEQPRQDSRRPLGFKTSPDWFQEQCKRYLGEDGSLDSPDREVRQRNRYVINNYSHDQILAAMKKTEGTADHHCWRHFINLLERSVKDGASLKGILDEFSLDVPDQNA